MCNIFCTDRARSFYIFLPTCSARLEAVAATAAAPIHDHHQGTVWVSIQRAGTAGNWRVRIKLRCHFCRRVVGLWAAQLNNGRRGAVNVQRRRRGRARLFAAVSLYLPSIKVGCCTLMPRALVCISSVLKR